MKKTNKTNLVRLMVILTIMTFFMFGCGKTEVATDTTEKEDVVVEVPETTTEVEEPQKEETVEEVQPEVEEQEEVVETEEPEPEVEEQEDVEYIKDYGTLDAYMEKLEVNKPAILIYNESEGYIVDMKEGQHYNLKKEDKIIINNTSGAKAVGYNFDLVLSDTDFCFYGDELALNYSNFEENQEFFYFIRLTDDEDPQRLTCYFNAPTE